MHTISYKISSYQVPQKMGIRAELATSSALIEVFVDEDSKYVKFLSLSNFSTKKANMRYGFSFPAILLPNLY